MYITYRSRHLTWYPSLDLAYTILNRVHLWTTHISCGLGTLLSHLRAWTTHIAFGHHKTVNQHHVSYPHSLCLAHNSQQTSGVDYPHRLCPAHNGESTSNLVCLHCFWTSYNSHMILDMGYWDCWHAIDIGMPISTLPYSIICSLHTSNCWHWIWTAYIVRRVYKLECQHRICPTCIIHCLNTPYVACEHLISDVGQWHASRDKVCTQKRRVHIFDKRRRTLKCGINKSLHARITCAHRGSDVGQATSSVAYPHYLWTAYYGQQTSCAAYPYLLWTTHNGQPTSDLVFLHLFCLAQNGLYAQTYISNKI